MEKDKLTFSSYFGVTKSTLDTEGFFNVSLISDLPLFIDPFHLFYSEKKEYQTLHKGIIDYLAFLRNLSLQNQGKEPSESVISAYYKFPEIKQNWLGFTFYGNRGRGLGRKFAITLNKNFNDFFSDFGALTESQHLEKLTLIANGVGKDTISDFTTNLIVSFLAEKTELFAQKYLTKEQIQRFTIQKAYFDFSTQVWVPKSYALPACEGDYVLLTPKDLLTKDDTWINKADMVKDFDQIPLAIENSALREQLSRYFQVKIKEHSKETLNKKTHKVTEKLSQKGKSEAVLETIAKFPQTIQVYISIKEKQGESAKAISDELVTETENIHEYQFANFAHSFLQGLKKPSSYEEMLERALYFKRCIELHDGYKNLYIGDDPVDEEWIQRMFRFTWYGSGSDLHRAPNNGLGEPDYVASQGRRDKAIAEFKLAKSSSLEGNIVNQLEKYKEVEKTSNGIWVIVFFTADEKEKVDKILKKHGLLGNKNYVLVDARKDNKIAPSKIKTRVQ